jgi:hypothetical protein
MSIEDEPMSLTNAPEAMGVDADALRATWLNRLEDLINKIEAWARTLDWSTRRIEKKMENSQIGQYRAPALLMQKETTRGLLEPIGPSAPGADGVVDLYLMPAYDDVASLFFYDGRWNLQYIGPRAVNDASRTESESKPLSRETFQEVLEIMIKNAS